MIINPFVFGGFDIDAQAYFTQISSLGQTSPSGTQKTRYNNTIVSTKILNPDGATNNFTEHDRLCLLASEVKENGLVSIRNPTSIISEQKNSPSWTQYQGFTFNGTNSYLDAHFTPSTDGVKFLQNDACIWIYSLTNNLTIGCDIGAANSAGGRYTTIFSKYTDNKTYADLNDNSTGVANNYITDTRGLILLRRSGTTLELYHQGVLKISLTSVSTAPVALSFFLGCRNLNGAASDFSNRQIAAYGWGSSKINPATLQYQIESVYLNSVGTGFPLEVMQAWGMIGQSNLTEFRAIAGLAAQYQAIQANAYTFIKNSDTSGDNGTIQNYHAGFNSWVGASGGSFYGPSATMVYKAYNTYGIKTIIDNSNIGNTCLFAPTLVGSVNTWDYSTGGNLYSPRALEYFFRMGIAKSNPLNKFGIISEFGENDGQSTPATSAFYANYASAIAKARSSELNGGMGRPNMPFILIKPNSSMPITNVTSIRNSIDLLVSNLFNVHSVDANSCALQGGDPIHYSDTGMQDLGFLLADKQSTITIF